MYLFFFDWQSYEVIKRSYKAAIFFKKINKQTQKQQQNGNKTKHNIFNSQLDFLKRVQKEATMVLKCAIKTVMDLKTKKMKDCCVLCTYINVYLKVVKRF